MAKWLMGPPSNGCNYRTECHYLPKLDGNKLQWQHRLDYGYLTKGLGVKSYCILWELFI